MIQHAPAHIIQNASKQYDMRSEASILLSWHKHKGTMPWQLNSQSTTATVQDLAARVLAVGDHTAISLMATYKKVQDCL